MRYTRVDTTFLALVDGEEVAVLDLTHGEVSPVGTRVSEPVGPLDLSDGDSVFEAVWVVYVMHREWVDAFRAARRVLEAAGFRVHLGKAVGRAPSVGRVAVYFEWPEGAVIRTKREEIHVWVEEGAEPRRLLEAVLQRLAGLGARVSTGLPVVEPLHFTRVELKPVAGRVEDVAARRAVVGFFLPSGSLRSLVSSKTVNVDPDVAEEALADLIFMLEEGVGVDEALGRVAKLYSPGAVRRRRASEAVVEDA